MSTRPSSAGPRASMTPGTPSRPGSAPAPGGSPSGKSPESGKPGKDGSTSAIRVIARFRPFSKQELSIKDSQIMPYLVDTDNGRVELMKTEGGAKEGLFTFDHVFGPSSTQEEVYNTAAYQTIEDVLEGYNGTIFAYGQTGSGKTHSMFGPGGPSMTVNLSGDEVGIVPRAASHIFRAIANDTRGTEYSIKCSYLQIYMEQVCDLLDPTTGALKIHETPSRGVYVGGLAEEFASCEQDILDLISIGESNRAVGNTKMNDRSSRSHCLFIITLHQRLSDNSTKTGKLNLVDLAGSEKTSKTGATGHTFDESKKINQSLSALGLCIMKLSEGTNSHVPFRDSKLTRILQESLGGNTKTTLLVACSPHEYNVDETVSTLKFAQRAKHIKNKVKKNLQRSAAELQLLVQTLSFELEKCKAYIVRLEKGGAPEVEEDEEEEEKIKADMESQTLLLAEKELELNNLKETNKLQLQELNEELSGLKDQVATLTKELEASQEVRVSLEKQNEHLSHGNKKMEYEVTETRVELETVKQREDELQLQHTNLLSEMGAAKADVIRMKGEVTEAENKLAHVTAEKDGLAENVSRAEASLAAKVEAHDHAVAKVQELEKKLEEQEAELDDLYNYITTLEQDLLALKNANEALEEDNKSMTIQVREAQTHARRASITSLQGIDIGGGRPMSGAFSPLKAIPDNAQMDIPGVPASVGTPPSEGPRSPAGSSVSEAQVVAVNEALMSAEKDLKEMQEKYDNLMAQNKEASNAHSKTLSELSTAQKTAEQEKTRHDNATQAFRAAQADAKVREDKHAEEKAEMQRNYDNKTALLNKTVEDYRSVINHKETEVITLQSDFQAMSQKCQLAEQKVEAQNKQLTRQADRVTELENEITALRQSKEELESRLAESKDQSEALEQEIVTMRTNRLALSRTSRAVKTITSGGSGNLLESYRAKEEFGQHMLRSTGLRRESEMVFDSK